MPVKQFITDRKKINEYKPVNSWRRSVTNNLSAKTKIGQGCHVGINTNQPLTYKHKENLKILDFFLSILTTERLFTSRKSQYPRFICYI